VWGFGDGEMWDEVAIGKADAGIDRGEPCAGWVHVFRVSGGEH
jgi:hypothetical protein